MLGLEVKRGVKSVQRTSQNFGGGKSDLETLKFSNAVQGPKEWQPRVKEKGEIRSHCLWHFRSHRSQRSHLGLKESRQDCLERGLTLRVALSRVGCSVPKTRLSGIEGVRGVERVLGTAGEEVVGRSSGSGREGEEARFVYSGFDLLGCLDNTVGEMETW